MISISMQPRPLMQLKIVMHSTVPIHQLVIQLVWEIGTAFLGWKIGMNKWINVKHVLS